MSGGTIDVRPTELRAAAPKFDSTADAVQRALTTLQHSLAAEDGCWGSGEIGSEFVKHYLPHHQHAETSFGTLASALRDTATAVTNAANAFEQTEQHNAKPFTGTGGPR